MVIVVNASLYSSVDELKRTTTIILQVTTFIIKKPVQNTLISAQHNYLIPTKLKVEVTIRNRTNSTCVCKEDVGEHFTKFY